MNPEKIIEILDSYKKYINFINNNGDNLCIHKIKVGDESSDHLYVTLKGYMGEIFEQEVFLSKSKELNVINRETGDNILLFNLEVNEDMSREDYEYIKYKKI